MGVTVPQASGYRWVVLGVGVLAQTAFGSASVGIAAVAAPIRTAYGLSIEQVGVALGAIVAGMFTTMLAWGVLADRVGERRVMCVGLLGASASLLAAGRVGGFGPLAGLLALSGAFGSSVNAASGRAVMGWFGPRERGLAMGIRQTALPLGGAIGALLLPAAATAGGARRIFEVLAALCLVGGLAAGAAVRAGAENAEPNGGGDSVGATESGGGRPGRVPLRDSRIQRLVATSFLLVLPQQAVLGFLALYLHDERGLPTSVAGVLLAGMNVLGGSARIALGLWSDRRGERVLLLRQVAAALAVVLAGAALGLVGPMPLAGAALAAAGVVAMSWNGLAFLSTAEAAPSTQRGAALGLQNTVVAMSVVLTSVGFAALVGAAGWGIAYATLPVAPVLAFVVLAPLAPARRAHRAAGRIVRTTAAEM
jgi:sugar phosphate permease